DRTLSRLVSSRLLAPATDYLACVVPTFELGRLAGLGLDIPATEEAQLRPAWTLAPDGGGDEPEPMSVELPVYHSWEFATGPNGDFQSLAMLLRARPLPPGVGERRIDVSSSGIGVDVPDGTTVPLGGALQPVAGPPAGWPDETVHQTVRLALAEVLNAADEMPAGVPLLTPPRYGAVQARRTTVDPAQPGRWYEQLNLEPAARVAAQFGTRIVQDHQETLVAAAWDQAAALADVNTVLRHAQFGRLVGWSLHRRHLDRMTPEAGLQVVAPAQRRLSRTVAANTPQTGLVAMFAAAAVPSPALGTAMRRLARPQGAINRRLTRRAGPGRAAGNRSILVSLRPGAMMGRLVGTPTSDGMATIDRVALTLPTPRTDITWFEADAAAVRSGPRQPGFQLLPWGMAIPVAPSVRPPTRPPRRPFRPVERAERRPPIDPDGPFDPFPDDPVDPDPFPDPVDEPVADPVDSAEAQMFRALVAAHLERFDPRPPRPPSTPVQAVNLRVLYDEVLHRIEPTETFAAEIRLVVDRGDGPTEPSDERALDTAGFTPHFPQPLAPALADLGQDLLLPDLEGVPPNTVVPLRTNSPFVEAVLVGFNAELGRELVWREFPTPLAATYADRFWDPGVAARPPDIPELATWADRPLGGTATNPATNPADERFVVLLRCELLRRYPHAVIYATKPGADPVTPIFAGAMEPDVRFFGFDIPAAAIADWSIVVAEQPTAPRFGLEVDAIPSGVTHAPLTGADTDAAQLARRVRQQPARITIPATVLLGEA
ncbi:MAG: hypothetical protein ABW195_16145, partial [Ilumatobacteraceae bacterium]